MEIIEQYLTYLKEVAGYRERTLDEYVRAVTRVNAEIDLLSVTKHQDITDAILRIKRKYSHKEAMTYKIASIIVSFYKWAHHIAGVVEINPYPFSPFKRPKLKEPAYIKEADFKKLIANPFLTVQDRALIHLLWDTGVRRGECSKLNDSDIDFEGNVAHIRRETSKGEYTFRYCPFTQETADILKLHMGLKGQYSRSNALFISTTGERLGENKISERVAEIGRFVDIKISPHTLRHSLPIRLLEAGASDIFVMKIMGHSSHEMLAHYTHISPEKSKKMYCELLGAS